MRRALPPSILDGLLLGSGDAVIGINPAGDSVAVTTRLLRLVDALRERFQIPVQSCVLAHITTQLAALEAGAPVDLLFQSIAGTEAANRSFGVNLALLGEAHEAGQSLHRGAVCADGQIGDNVMYFETGQGSALSANAHHGVDQQTLEARAYAVARHFRPMLVNTVVGFIGPEYLYDGKQIVRAGLEDHFCGKLLGLPMGCDVCYTNHAEADQDDMDTLLTLLGAAGVNYIMGVPGADDVMLNYQSTSFHDALYLRRVLGLRPAPEFEAWLQGEGFSRLALEAHHPERLLDGMSEMRASTRTGSRAGRAAARAHPGARGTGPHRREPADPRPAGLSALAMRRPATPSMRGLRPRRWRRPATITGGEVLRFHSAAADRATYLQRPDLGRKLDEASRASLAKAQRTQHRPDGTWR